MRDFKEYEDIFSKLSYREVEYIKTYLNLHPQYTHHDIYYTSGINDAFGKWRDHKDIMKLSYCITEIKDKLRGDVTLKDLVDYIEDYEELRDHVYAYAKEHLQENSLGDKFHTMNAIECPDIEYLYNYDTEVREKFVECCQGGMTTLKEEIKTRLKHIQQDERAQSRKNKEEER